MLIQHGRHSRIQKDKQCRSSPAARASTIWFPPCQPGVLPTVSGPGLLQCYYETQRPQLLNSILEIRNGIVDLTNVRQLFFHLNFSP